jgi:hypothetical protein
LWEGDKAELSILSAVIRNGVDFDVIGEVCSDPEDTEVELERKCAFDMDCGMIIE